MIRQSYDCLRFSGTGTKGEADLRLCFWHMQIVCFLMQRLILFKSFYCTLYRAFIKLTAAHSVHADLVIQFFCGRILLPLIKKKVHLSFSAERNAH